MCCSLSPELCNPSRSASPVPDGRAINHHAGVVIGQVNVANETNEIPIKIVQLLTDDPDAWLRF
jgi:hypothetical protein